jgi:hypothetical protein
MMSETDIPNGGEMTAWGKTRKELYDEAMSEFEAAKVAGLKPDPFPWLTRGRSVNAPPLERRR